MTKGPLISIIVPVFNTEPYLPKCLSSLIRQTYANLEILLVNDGSKDNSGKICSNFAQTDKRIQVFHQENQGVSAARNFALDKANGEWLFFLDSDDWLADDCIEHLYDISLKTGAKVCVCGHKNVLLNLPVEGPKNYKNILYTRQKCIQQYCLGNLSYAVWGKLWHKHLFNGVYFSEGISVGEDLQVSSQIILKLDSLAFSEGPRLFRLVRPESANHSSYSEKQIKDLISIADEIAHKANGADCQIKKPLRCLELGILLGIFSNLSRHSSNSPLKITVAKRARLLCKNAVFYNFLPARYRLKFAAFCFSPQLFISVKNLIKRY